MEPVEVLTAGIGAKASCAKYVYYIILHAYPSELRMISHSPTS
jgi:hypothetical protein